MKSLITFLSIFLTSLMLTGQAADPELTAPGISPAPGLRGDEALATVTLQNESPTAVPYNALNPTQISITLNKIQPDFLEGELVVVVSNGPSWFTWTAECNSGCGTETAVWIVTGTQNQVIPGIDDPFLPAPSQTYDFPGTVTAESSEAEALAFNGHGFNANIIPCAFSGDCDAENGPESNNQSIYSYTETILPVTLSDFIARKIDGEVYLTWITSSEVDNDYFEIQHSMDGTSWSSIGEVEGNGTTQETKYYDFTHNNPSPGINYYRLLQVDFNGRSDLSDVRMVKFENDKVELMVNYFPNPTVDRIQIVTNNQILENYTVIVTDLAGRVLRNENFQNRIHIDMKNLKGGVYLARLIDEDGKVVSTQKIIKISQ